MKFGGIDWDNRHPETRDIEPGSCDWWMQMDNHFGTSPDSPLHHQAKHVAGGCKPMDRIPKENIDKITSWNGGWTGKWHTIVHYWTTDNKQAFVCSCYDDREKDFE